MDRWLAVFAVVVGLLGAATPPGAASPMWTLPDPHGALTPSSIAAGPHGTMWVASSTLNVAGNQPHYGFARVDLAGRYKLVHTRGATASIAVAADGTVYATETFAGRIAILSPGGQLTEIPVSLPQDDELGAIAAGPDGNGWFTEDRSSKVARITPAGAITEFDLPQVPEWGLPGYFADATPSTIEAGRDGRLWVGIDNGVATVTTTGAVEEHSWAFSYPAEPSSLAAAPDGTMWATELEQPTLDHIDAAGNAVSVPGVPDGLVAVAPDGVVSAFHGGAAERLRIAPGGAATREPLIVGLGPHSNAQVRAHGLRAAAPGPAGTMWIVAELAYADGGSTEGVVVIDDGGRCIVPSLRFDSLAEAKFALRAHDCRPGRVTRRNPPHFPASLLQVTKQSLKPGAVRKRGTNVAFTLRA